jgi:hypothetical protein
MPLLIVIEKMPQRNVNMVSIVEKTTHKLVKYKCDETAKSELLDIMKSNTNESCIYGIIFLQIGQIYDALNILNFLVKRAGANMRCS